MIHHLPALGVHYETVRTIDLTPGDRVIVHRWPDGSLDQISMMGVRPNHVATVTALIATNVGDVFLETTDGPLTLDSQCCRVVSEAALSTAAFAARRILDLAAGA